ncbi:MAG TPA: hypothetical protein VFA65_03765 [Bryobacteraceae bacterium]|nr:hypothetical protein [Bryobacteraceae bacterium]
MKPSEPEAVKQIVKQVADSGRCATLAEAPDKRVDSPAALPPGPPPLLSFRFYESKAHHRVGNSELMLDDAGH